MTTRYYHASPRRFRVGTTLEGGHTGGSGYAHEMVCLTNDPVPHGTIVDSVDGWHVYEVTPVGPVVWDDGNEEYQVKEAVVTRYVGTATGILNNVGPKKRRTGSLVTPRGGRAKKFLGGRRGPNVKRVG